jgi:DNA adenine methylase
VKARTLLERAKQKPDRREGLNSEPLLASGLLKPPLKWAGGKRWLLPHLAPLWHSHSFRRYVEPFCGGLAAALGLRPSRALLNDINPHLINLYAHLQRGLEITIEMKNDEPSFYRDRSRFNQLIKDGEWQGAEAAHVYPRNIQQIRAE